MSNENKFSVTIANPITKNPERNWKSYNIENKWIMLGYSRAADRTFFSVPSLRLGLDAGGCRGRQPDFVFVTHSHTDHSADLWYLAQNENSQIYIPEECKRFAENAIISSWELNLCMNIETKPVLPLYYVKSGDIITWGKGNNYRARVYNCIHKVPTVGYAFYEVRSRLKEEFKGKPGKEIAQLKKQGISITEEYHNNMFVYMGDTSTKVFELHPWLFDYPTIITECTFLLDEHDRAERDGHTHWDLLKPIILSHPNITFVLIHFSLRYKEQEVYDYFNNLTNQKDNPINLSNVIIHIGDGSEGRL